jgi:hypothetical protein
MVKRLALLAALALAGCSASQTNAAFVAAESGDAVALSALVAYEKTPTVNKAVVTKLLADQQQFDTAAAPAEAQVAAGQPVTNAAALTGVLAVLSADEATAGISPTTSGSN